ncbi:Protein of unknown function [Gryllus bimaculatus]|nr:Protein of unknown function [Gryllus bimaculatus]
MSLIPFFRNPITDLTGSLVSRQHFEKCGEFEMRMLQCLEAYGMDRGKQKCADLIEDFSECQTKWKQVLRVDAMRIERNRQVNQGERSKDQMFAEAPTQDSF